MVRHFLDLHRLEAEEMRAILDDAHARKAARKGWPKGRVDAGSLLAILYKAGFPHLAHGPMASDGARHDATGRRAVEWLVSGDRASLEPSRA